MKKFGALLLAVLLCLNLAACGIASKSKENSEVTLTTENIYEFLAFDVTIENVQRWQTITYEEDLDENGIIDSDEAVEDTSDDSGFSSCDILLETYAKKPVVFDSLEIAFDFVPEQDEFESLAGQTLTFKYDGTASEKYQYRPENEPATENTPVFKVVVTKVSGKAIYQ